MIKVRTSGERGRFDHGWLDTRHTFSFAAYHDPAHMGFRALRVLNEDRVAPGGGFPTHGHADMEIVSYVVSGVLEHQDSSGRRSKLGAGGVQRMSAGSGVMHSEYNGSNEEALHFLQVWLYPERRGLEPSYEERVFGPEERRNRLRVLVSPSGEEGALRIHQDARLFGGLLDAGQKVEHPLAAGRHAWVQVVGGELELNGTYLEAGDGAAISDESRLSIESLGASELVLFDLA